jgi:adenylate cyclase
MDFEAEARRDVEAALRTGRDELERSVARGRLALFVSLTIFGAILSSALIWTRFGSALGTTAWWGRAAPFGVFGLGAVYAFLVWHRISHKSALSRRTAIVAFIDPAWIALSVVALRRLMEPPNALPGEPLAARFDIYALAPIMMVLLFLGCVRLERGLRLPLAAFSVAVYLAAIWLDLGHFEAPQLLASLLIVVSAVLGSQTSNRMADMLDRQSRLSLLRSYLPEAFAERLSTQALDLGDALKPQATEVTLLVTDLRGFTSMSEAMAPAEVVAMLAEYHTAMLGAVEATGGTVDKFLGDGMLVVFGLPLPGRDPPRDAGAAAAVQCAAAMLGRLAQLNAVRVQSGRAPLAMGAGIHTGPVIAGTIGAGRRREFTVIGDAVNTASRLEGLTKSAAEPVLLSAATAARLEGAASSLRELAPMAVKGKAEPVRIFALEQGSALLTPSPTRG